jgi:hypothetical protein
LLIVAASSKRKTKMRTKTIASPQRRCGMRKKNKPAKFDDVQIENGAVNDLGERI